MSDWAAWLVANGQADEVMVAEAERVLEAAALVPGDTVLDVGSGLGLLTLAAHDRIGDGWVIAVDPSVGALEELLRLAHEAKANGIMYLVGDARRCCRCRTSRSTQPYCARCSCTCRAPISPCRSSRACCVRADGCRSASR